MSTIPVVHVDPATNKADGPHMKKLRTYLGIVARDRVDIMYENWKEVPTAQKGLDLGGYSRCAEKDTGDPETEHCPPCFVSWGYEYLEQKLLAEKIEKKLEETAQSGSIDGVIDPPSPVRRLVQWKMAHTKKTRDITTEAAKEIVEKIVSHFQLTIRIIFQYFVNFMYNCAFSVQDSFEEQATQGSFVPHGHQDVLTTVIGRPKHPRRVRAAGAGVTIKQYFGSAPWTSHSSSSLPPEELQQLTQQIKDQLEESIT
ncbi:hypothetical protein GmHk_15G044683 [Glycine max]|nr:hypothetical protein GmHk_15G044683 [Glycine max]